MIVAERLTETVTLYEGDCLDVLPTLEPGSVDAVVTDPPYGIDAAKRGTIGTSKSGIVKNYGKADWDSETADDAVKLAVSISRYAVVFGGNYYNLPPSSCWLVWDKLNSGDFADCELAWTNLPKAVRRLQHRWNGMIRQGNEERVHPTQKPLRVMRWCIRQLPADAKTIIDPFAGSGTTAIAAMQEGRSCILIEKDPRYCEIIRERVRKADGRAPGTLFASTVPTLFEHAQA